MENRLQQIPILLLDFICLHMKIRWGCMLPERFIRRMYNLCVVYKICSQSTKKNWDQDAVGATNHKDTHKREYVQTCIPWKPQQQLWSTSIWNQFFSQFSFGLLTESDLAMKAPTHSGDTLHCPSGSVFHRV